MTILRRVARLRASASPIRITVFGSSTTEGYGASDPATTGYPPRMQAALRLALPENPVTLGNLGISGENIDDMAQRIPDVVSSMPDLVIWQAGSNDGPQGITVAHFETLMTRGITRIAATGADLVLMEPQFCTVLESAAEFPPFLASIRGLAARHGLAVFPRYTLMQNWARETGLGIAGLSPDGMHMGDPGYRLLGEAVAAFIVAASD